MKTKLLNRKKSLTFLFTFAILLGTSNLFAQVKIGSNPTVIESNSNLEIEASTPNRKVKVDKATGQMTIQDGTEGAGKILTSDAAGGASWQSVATARIPETVFVGAQSSTPYSVTPFSGTFNQLKDRIPLVPRAGSLPGYDPATKLYTIQEDGYYRINIGGRMQGSVAGATPTFIRLYMATTGVLEQYDNFNAGTGPTLSTYWEGFYPAGTIFAPYVALITNGGTPQTATVTLTFMSITKLF